MTLRTILFDLDETLYPSENGLWQVLRDRMGDYMHDRLQIPLAEIPQIRQKYYETYGTTLRGLERDYMIKAEDYLKYVHNVPIQEFIKPDPLLKEILEKLPYRKVIFTNADENHSRRVLDALGVRTCFNQVIDVMAMAPFCKPYREAFMTAMNLVGDTDPSSYLLLDDAPKNVEAAMEVGMHAILVSKNHPTSDNMVRIENIHLLPEILATLTR